MSKKGLTKSQKKKIAKTVLKHPILAAVVATVVVIAVVYVILNPGVLGFLTGGDNSGTELAKVGFGKDLTYNGLTIPDYAGDPFYVLNNNVPFFDASDKAERISFELYGELDSLGRCTACYACVGTDLMPVEGETRGSISSVYPTGWKYNGKSNNKKYDASIISTRDLYNRCHLIGHQLTAENANNRNLITGTRYLNIDGMIDFENMVADYLKENPTRHVLYRVTPIFGEDNLVAYGLVMEGYSVEDNGEGISYCVFSYNVQPGVKINYATGENDLAD